MYVHQDVPHPQTTQGHLLVSGWHKRRKPLEKEMLLEFRKKHNIIFLPFHQKAAAEIAKSSSLSIFNLLLITKRRKTSNGKHFHFSLFMLFLSISQIKFEDIFTAK